MLAGKLGRAGWAVISPLRKTRGRGGCRQISTAGTCPLNLLRNSSPKHERPTHLLPGASAGSRVADTVAVDPLVGWPYRSRGVGKAARAPTLLAQKNFLCGRRRGRRGRPRPLGRSAGNSWGANSGLRAALPRGKLEAIGALVPGQGLPRRALKDGDATGLPGTADPDVAAHTRWRPVGLRGLAALEEGLCPRPAGHP
jgi:hypothetical protein